MGIYTKKIYEKLGLEEKNKNVFYGKYNGYEVTLIVNQQFFVFINFYANANVKAEASKIFQTAVNANMVMTSVDAYGIKSAVNGMTFKTALDKLKGKLDATTEYLKSQEALGVGYCPSCGEAIEIPKTIKVNDLYVTLDEKCYSQLEAAVSLEQSTYNNQPNNYLNGFFGALLGAAIGAVLWVILYFIGFVTSLTAILAVFLGNYFYVKFGGKANNVKNVIVAVVSLVVLVLACFGLYIYVVDALLVESNINMSALEYILQDPELKSAFIYDMGMNAFFTIIGVVAQIIYTKKKDQAGRTTISK